MTTSFLVAVDWDHNGTWTDETSRVYDIDIRSGFDAPGEPVAAVGRCRLVLANDDQRFSPEYAAGPLAGKLLPRRAVRVRATDGTTIWTLFRGYVECITPDAGQYGAHCAVIDCVDGLSLLARQTIGVPHEDSKAVDAAVGAAVSAAYTPPSTSYDDNADVLSHYGRSWQPEHTSCRDALREICEAVYGRFLVARDGTAVFQSKDTRQDSSGAAACLAGVTYADRVRRTLSTRLVGYWPLSEQNGTVAADTSGNDFDGTAAGVAWGADGIGDDQTAATFDGSATVDVFSSGLAGAMDTAEFTLALWIKPTAACWQGPTNRRPVFFWADTNNRIYMGKYAEGGFGVTYLAGGVSRGVSRSGLSSETDWLHVAVTVSASANELRWYWNGTQYGSTITGLGTWSGAITLAVIGAMNTTPDCPWLGGIAHVALWDTALSADQIAKLAAPFRPGAVDELDVSLGIERVINRCAVTVYPVETVGTLTEIWRARTVLHLAPGQTRVIHAPFRDENGERVAAVDVVEPVASTDYTVNDQADGTGFDYTESPHFSLSADIEATRATITLTNTAIGPLYVTLLTVRGKPIRVYDPITIEAGDESSQDTYEVRAQVFDLPMQTDLVFAETLADYVIGRCKDPAMSASRVIVRSRDVIGDTNVFSLDLCDRVLVSDPESGIDTLLHTVCALEYHIDRAGYTVMLWLERADDQLYWHLEQDGFSEIGSTTRLGL
ncbi:MAG: LamG domain-containing protein [Anaerolineae bacterium]|nr:LamG domain-containing protein [Anaerolineae bacterium]